jgi:hypothetical protein
VSPAWSNCGWPRPRIYLLPDDGGCRLLAEPLSKARHDILLILTDGAWTPLGPVRLERAARKAALAHFSDVPPAILDAAGQHGRADDMTAVAIRLAPH